MDFLDEQEETPDSVPDSQQQDPTDAEGLNQVSNSLKGKGNIDNDENRPPPHARRAAATGNRPPTLRKPVTLAEIRESVSFLIEDTHMVPDSQFESSESEADVEMEDSAAGALNDGTEHSIARRTSATVIDRLTLSRTSTDSSEASGSSLAFVAPSKTHGQGGFRVPSLLRRATSRLSEAGTWSNDSSTSSGSTTPVENARVRRGGNARSNIHYQAREAERQRVLGAAEEKRKAGLKKKVKAGGSRGLKNVLSGATGWD
jgi:mediator of replication checkpoint protein 1